MQLWINAFCHVFKNACACPLLWKIVTIPIAYSCLVKIFFSPFIIVLSKNFTNKNHIPDVFIAWQQPSNFSAGKHTKFQDCEQKIYYGDKSWQREFLWCAATVIAEKRRLRRGTKIYDESFWYLSSYTPS